MKGRYACIVFCFCAVLILGGCGRSANAGAKPVNDQVSVESNLEQAAEGEQVSEENALEESSGNDEGIDVDLTDMSSTMVYSEVYNMVYYPEQYIGKKVKMNGIYVVYHDEVTDRYYHGCIISDATACCSQGIEFELAGDTKYPDDYPADGQGICVVGTFDTYMEDGSKYCTLRDAAWL